MNSTHHLWRRRGRANWYFQLRVPEDLRHIYGKMIQTALGTSDVREAKLRRDQLLGEWRTRFEAARQQPALEDVLRRIRHRELARAHAEWGGWDDDNVLEGAGPDLEELRTMAAGMVDVPLSESDHAYGQAARALRDHGLQPTPEAVRAAADAMARAEADAGGLVIKGKPLPAMPNQPRRKPARGKVTVGEAVELWIAERTRDPSSSWRQSTSEEIRTTARWFAEHAGDPPLADVTREDASRFLDALGGLHNRAAIRREARGLPFPELVSRYPGPPHVSNKTINQRCGWLHGLWRWARKRGIYEGENPFADQHRKDKQRRGWLPYTVEELSALFADVGLQVRPESHTAATAMPWIMLVALYSGMRLNEIAELATVDVQEQDGVPFLDVTEAKSEAGVRRVPVHSELIRAGFMGYVEHIRSQKHAQLWPALKPGGRDGRRGHYISKRFTEQRRARGVTRERVAFHSFRKTFVRALELAGVDRDRAALVVGHERGFTFRVYNPEGVDVAALREVVEAVRYPGLELDSAARDPVSTA